MWGRCTSYPCLELTVHPCELILLKANFFFCVHERTEEQRHIPTLELSSWGSYDGCRKAGRQRRHDRGMSDLPNCRPPKLRLICKTLEDNFREFISFLGDNHVDLTNVKKRSVDDDEFPQHKKDDDVDEVAVEAAVAAVEEKAKSEDEIAKEEPKEPKEQGDASREKAAMAFDLGRRLSCRWSTGAGARIGCVRDYPADLQSKALEQVNLSPRVVASPAANKVPPVPIPSPRPSPRVRLSPRLQYMGIPTPPTVSLTLPKSWR
ncbi:hypothetical protein BHE74_00007012 [Ensete ventricosum]|nr:hypothetical protein BHE74_00007012 [Ensete ventricosum]